MDNQAFHSELRSQIKKLCQKKIWPHAEEDDRQENFRMDVYRELGEMGLAGMALPEEFGGLGLGYQDLCVGLSEVARASVSYAVTLSVSGMVQNIINEHGTQEQKERCLPVLTTGQEIGAFALTESSAGSDASSLRTQAKKVPGGFELTGNKMFITSGGIAKTYVVMARTGGEGAKGISAFLVDAKAPGLSFGKKERKMGWKVSPTRELVFQNCFVSDRDLLGQLGEGFKIAASALDRGRVTIASLAVGLAEEALAQSLAYAKSRQQFQKAIADFQGIEFMLADMATEIEASRALTDMAAKLCDQYKLCSPSEMQALRPKVSLAAAMAKLKATDAAMKVTTDAVQILGGVGYTSEYPVERMMRDAKVLQIVEGTNQIQRVVISRILKQL